MAKKKPAAKRTAKVDPLAHITPDLRPLAVPIDSLKPDPRNARKHDAKNLASIANSLARFGQRKPVIVNTINGVIEAGNGTIEAAKSLGWTMIAVVRVEDDPTTQSGFAIADNRTAELAAWDLDVLLELSLEVQSADGDMYDDLLIAELLAGDEPDVESQADRKAPQCESYTVVIQCVDEDEQRRLFQRLKKEGLPCKVVTL